MLVQLLRSCDVALDNEFTPVTGGVIARCVDKLGIIPIGARRDVRITVAKRKSMLPIGSIGES